MKSIIQPILSLIVVLILSTPASAAFIVVNTSDNEENDDGDCSLREAVRAANENIVFDNCPAGGSLGTDDIFIAQTGTINLTQHLLITEQVNIFGPGIDALTLDAQSLDRHFTVNMPDESHDFSLSDMTLENGESTFAGGSMRLRHGGTFTIEDVQFESNRSNLPAGLGGAIATTLPIGNGSSLVIRRCRFTANVSEEHGGAIGVTGINDGFGAVETLTIEESLFQDNVAFNDGGALFAVNISSKNIDQSVFDRNSGANGGAMYTIAGPSDLSVVSSSTFTNNSSNPGNGGAIEAANGVLLVRNSTFTANQAASTFGNALSLGFDNTTAIFHSTFIANDSETVTTESTIYVTVDASVSMSHSIVFSEGASMIPECEPVAAEDGTFTSLGYNIDTSGTCTGHATDLPMTDPELAPLGDYGDDSASLILQTFLPKTGSPAIEGGKLGPCDGGLGSDLTKDQRGQARPNNLRCDIGAVEYQFANDPDAFNLIVEIGSGAGTVTSNPDGIDCTGTCVENFLDGTQVTLTAMPDPGFAFSNWADNCSGTGACQVTMTIGRRVVANFVPSGFSLETLIDGNSPGAIISLPEGID